MSQGQTYAGWQPEKSGFIGGLSLTGFVFVLGAAIVVLIPLYRSSWSSLLIAAPLALLLVGLAYVRVGGLAADEWLVLALRHSTNGALRRNAFLSGGFAPARLDDVDQLQPIDLPGPLACLRVLEAPTGTGDTAAVVNDPLANMYSAVMRLRPPGLALADTARQDHRVNAWGAFLASL